MNNPLKDIQKPFRLTLEHYGEKVTIERNRSDLTNDELIDMFVRLASAAGFHIEIEEK